MAGIILAVWSIDRGCTPRCPGWGWGNPSWGWTQGVPDVVPGLSPWSQTLPSASPNLELWQISGAVAAELPALELGTVVSPGLSSWSLALPVTSPSWGLRQVSGTVSDQWLVLGLCLQPECNGWALPALLPGWGLSRVLPELLIFPSSFCNNLLDLFICLSLIFKYLNSPTLFIRSWHCCIIYVVTMDASCDLHLSSCLLLLSRKLLMDLTLACRGSLSGFLIIFLAFFCFNCGIKPDTNWYNSFIHASECEYVVVPVVTVLHL